MHLGRTAVRRASIALAVIALLAAGLFSGPAGVAAAPPKPGPAPGNPTNDQLNNADAQKSALDVQVGQLSGQIAAAQARLADLQRRAELAEQRVAYAVTEYRKASAEADRAEKMAATAVTKVRDAQTRFAQYMQATYADGRPGGMTGTLLTASDPTALLEQTSYQQYEVQRSAGVIGEMQTLSLAKSNAQAKAQQAKTLAKQKQRAAEQAQRAAAVAVQNQQAQQATLETTMSQKQTELTTAKAKQVELYRQRANYNEYVVELRAYQSYVAEQKRLAEIARQQRLERQRQREAAERAEERAKRDRGGKRGGGNSSNDDPPVYSPPAPSGGSWSLAKAKRAVARAKTTLGTPYAWAGGGPGGPSYGACVPSAGAPNDCYIRGYDCSGLVMYAWGKNWDHYADTQYSQAGSYHPKRSQLKVGDLVFFGYRGGGSDLHHVAMYIGGGRIIEAPYSGGYVQYNSLNAYSDYYGATRPLT